MLIWISLLFWNILAKKDNETNTQVVLMTVIKQRLNNK